MKLLRATIVVVVVLIVVPNHIEFGYPSIRVSVGWGRLGVGWVGGGYAKSFLCQTQVHYTLLSYCENYSERKEVLQHWKGYSTTRKSKVLVAKHPIYIPAINVTKVYCWVQDLIVKVVLSTHPVKF